MLDPVLEDKVQDARHALKSATSENIIELCKQYLAILAEYRSQLHELQGTSGIDIRLLSSPLPEKIANNRKVVRTAIENNTQERNLTAALLRSFTSVSGYEAVEVFNRLQYKAHCDWELRAGGVISIDGDAQDLMSINEAVDMASELRREEYIAQEARRRSKKFEPDGPG